MKKRIAVLALGFLFSFAGVAYAAGLCCSPDAGCCKGQDGSCCHMRVARR